MGELQCECEKHHHQPNIDKKRNSDCEVEAKIEQRPKNKGRMEPHKNKPTQKQKAKKHALLPTVLVHKHNLHAHLQIRLSKLIVPILRDTVLPHLYPVSSRPHPEQLEDTRDIASLRTNERNTEARVAKGSAKGMRLRMVSRGERWEACFVQARVGMDVLVGEGGERGREGSDVHDGLGEGLDIYLGGDESVAWGTKGFRELL
ncbi:hypothetical protein DXG01_015210 [Tephrocybe rancida]|nr:hypothetical protein DXG01_015210 [Tephrocybe rancida]